MKAIIVIDMPDYVDFNICKTADVGLCFNAKGYTEPLIKSNVPLRPIPKRKNIYTDIEALGWNACLGEIDK